MATKQLPDTDILRKLLRYDEATGKLYWRHRNVEWFKSEHAAAIWNAQWPGKEVGTPSHGYVCVAVFGKRYLAHRVIMAMHLGRDLIGQVDHINGDGLDNRRANLRVCSVRQNVQSMRKWRGSSKYNYKDLW